MSDTKGIKSKRPRSSQGGESVGSRRPQTPAIEGPVRSKRPTSAVDSTGSPDVQSLRDTYTTQTAVEVTLEDFEGKTFDHKQKRKHEKGIVNFDSNDPPSKANKYHNARMSDILRDYRGRTTADILTADKEFEEDDEENAIQRFIKESHEKKLVPRIYLATTAVVFLWMSSVGACRGYIQLFIPFPRYNQFTDSVNALLDGATTERNGYFDCVTEELETCQVFYGLQSATEGQRLAGVQNANAAVLSEFYGIRDTCRSNLETALDILEIIATVDDLNFEGRIAPVNTILDDEGNDICQEIRDLFQVQIAQVAAMNKAEELSDESTKVINDYEQQFQERQDYETSYHENVTVALEARPDPLTENLGGTSEVNIILQRGLDIMKACFEVDFTFTGSSGTQTCPEESRIAFRAQAIIDVYVQKYLDFAALIATFEQTIEDVIEIGRIIRGFLKFLKKIGIKKLDFDTPNLGNLNKLGFDQFDFDLSTVTDFIDPEFAAFEANMEAEIPNMDLAIEGINFDATQFAANLRGDFETPSLSIETLSLIELALITAANLPQLISDDLLAINTDIDIFEVETPFDVIIEGTDIDFLTGFGDRSISFFSYPDSFFFDLDFNVTNFFTYILTIDILIRILQSVLIWKRYYNMTEYSTPPAIVTSEKGTLFKQRKNTLQKLVDILGSGTCTMIYTLSSILIVSLLFYLAYTPLYEEFVDGCVRNEVADINVGLSDGTMLYRNIETSCKGFAQAKGDRAITTDIDKFNLDRDVACTDLLKSSVDIRQQHSDSHDDLRKSIERINIEYQRFDQCVDWQQYDADKLVIGAVAQAYTDNGLDITFSMDATFGNATCRDEGIAEIDLTANALHNCSNVDTCDANVCSGPNIDNIQRLSHNAACTAEFGAHSYLLASLFAVTMFTCLNFARYYAMKGILQVWFEYFTPDMYSYLVSCTEAGTILPPKKVQDGKAGFVELRKRSLDRVLAKFKRGGYVNLLFAFLVNAPWMVFLVLFTRDLEFNEN